MSSDYLARDLLRDRPVVLRLLPPELSADERFRERFLRESELATALDHPNILPILEAGEADGTLYVSMAYIEGGDLARLLSVEGRLEPERAVLIVTQLAQALDAARWSQRLVHGNLQPSDVLVVPAGDAGSGERVLLRGFGLRQELCLGQGFGRGCELLRPCRLPRA